MIRTAIVMAAAALALTSGVDAQTTRRAVNQQKRIAGGVASGDLTAREAAKLEREQKRNNRITRRDAMDDGKLNASERAAAKRRQDRASRNIYKEKSDGDKR